ncbi:protein FRG1-like isoform 1 [Anopheles sinensis]|uniref:Protein FRG1-like isoform 1 n=1 Tax=Anopheles sinensis TaxID=74873 RepID=A0A084WHA1_ANOSI|nr:protein FRG1-like isoform 1 [Anopheles sinensis]
MAWQDHPVPTQNQVTSFGRSSPKRWQVPETKSTVRDDRVMNGHSDRIGKDRWEADLRGGRWQVWPQKSRPTQRSDRHTTSGPQEMFAVRGSSG